MSVASTALALIGHFIGQSGAHFTPGGVCAAFGAHHRRRFEIPRSGRAFTGDAEEVVPSIRLAGVEGLHVETHLSAAGVYRALVDGCSVGGDPTEARQVLCDLFIPGELLWPVWGRRIRCGHVQWVVMTWKGWGIGSVSSTGSRLRII